MPPFFYLSNCHGNDAAAVGEGQATVESLAARLHREGVVQVVAYSGPILDVLATEAEAALYAAIADGHTTRYAVRQAREALCRPIGPGRSVLREVDPRRVEAMRDSHPFAWSQLVLYHRGPDHPLSQPPPPGERPVHGDGVLQRTYLDVGTRRILATGFIGRRTELHRLRRKVREGQRVFVLQGLGGLGKSTLAFHTLKEILHAGDDLCTLWCQDAEKAGTAEGIAEVLVGQLLDYCRKRFGSGWEGVVQQVDRIPGADPAQRFQVFLHVLAENVERLVVYLDNLESLLIGPEDVGPADPEAFAQWRTPALAIDLGNPDPVRPRQRQGHRGRELPLSQRRFPPGADPGRTATVGGLVPVDGVVSRPATAVGRVAGPAGEPAGRPPPGRRVRQ